MIRIRSINSGKCSGFHMPEEKLRYQTCIGGGYVLKRIIGHSEDDETFPTYVGSRTGCDSTEGVNQLLHS